MSSLTDVFEVNFSKLAEAALKAKAPRLMDRGYIGFQAIDKTDDESFAVGMAAFLLNKVWLYVPVFFIENQIKGVEQALIKHRRMIVPLSDKWINTIEEQGRDILGDIFVEGDLQSLQNGGSNDPATDDDLYKGSEKIDIPRGLDNGVSKYSSDDIVPREIVEEMRRRCAAASFGSFNLMDGLRSLGKEASLKFLEWTAGDPDFANAVFEHYTEGDLYKLAAETAESVDEPPAEKETGIVIVDLNADSPEEVAAKTKDLSDTQKRVLNQNGFYVKDTRGPDKVSCVFRMSGAAGYSNATESGKVEIVGRDGAAASADVHIIEGTGRADSKAQTDRNLIVVFDDGTWRGDSCGGVLVKHLGDADMEEPHYRDATEKLLKEMAVTSDQVRVLLVKDNKAIEAYLDMDGGTLVARHAESTWTGVRRVVFGKRGRLGGRLDSVLNVPAGTKFIELSGEKRNVDFRPVRDMSDMIDSARLDSSYIPLVLKKPREGYGVVVDLGDGATTLPRREALMWLTEKMGVRAEESSNMLKSASVGGETYWIRPAALHKRAAASAAEYGTKAPRMRLTTPEEREYRMNADAKLRSNAMEAAARADGTGVREVFDVEVMKALFATGDVAGDQAEAVRQWIKAMDGIGRYLLTVYWNYDKFVSNFGKEDVEVFENSARDTFDAMGDLILFVRERLKDPSEASGREVDLGDMDYGDTGALE